MSSKEQNFSKNFLSIDLKFRDFTNCELSFGKLGKTFGFKRVYVCIFIIVDRAIQVFEC